MNKKGLVGVVKFSLVAIALIVASMFIINFVLPTVATSEPKDILFQVTNSDGIPVTNSAISIWTSSSADGTFSLESTTLTDTNGFAKITTSTDKYSYFIFEKKGYQLSWPKETTEFAVVSPEFFVINTNDIISSEIEPIIISNLDVIPQIWSDKSNYNPEETAIFSGAGFDYDYVQLRITWPNSTVVYINDIAVGQDGSFNQPYQLDGITGEFSADAIVSENVLASTFFDDDNETTVKLFPSADSWVNANSVNQNYGSSNLLQVTNTSSTYIRQTYIKFDLGTIPSGKTLTAATLHMYVTSDGEPTSRTLGTYFISDDSWTESGIKWNNKPSIGGMINSTSVGSGVWIVWDVIGNVQTEYNGDKVISMALTFPQQNSMNYKYFYSKEYTCSGKRPYLEVKYENVTNPTHSECSNGQCIQVNGTGDNQCSIASDCYHSECDYVGRTCKQINAWPDVQDQCTNFNQCIHNACIDESCVTVDSPGVNQCQSNEECTIPTHSECSNGQCTIVQGLGQDQCSIASDCYHKECNFGSQQCIVVNAWPDVIDSCTSNEQCTACLPDIVVSKKATPSSFSICQNTTVTLNVTGTGCPQTVHFPIDAMIVFDRTGSMDDDCPGGVEANTSPCKIHEAKVAAKFFVGLLNSSLDRSGLVSFNNTATLNQGLTFNGALVQSAIDTLKALGQTAIGGGISAANNELTSHGRNNSQWIEILLTDGNENLGSDPISRANEAKAAGIIIYTIGLGASVDASLLQNIASITGGKYYFAPNGTSLQQIYLNISQEILNISGKNVVVKDVIPAYANYADALSSNPADNCSYSAGTKTITCNLGNVLIGQSYIITFNEQINQSGSNILTNVYPNSNVTFTDFNNSQQTRVFPQTFVNVTACDDGVFCNGVETCSQGSCQQGTPLNCSSLNDQCKIGECNEAFKNCTVSFKQLSTPCNDGLWCSATDHCDGLGNCVQLTPRDCTGFNLTKIETCDNNPDNYHFTWDFRNLFTSICNETIDSCTNGNNTITHTCSVVNCTAECDATHSCQNKCVGNVWYSSGNCSLTTCNCSYSTQNCDLQDDCYVYDNGCEDRDYFCQLAGCNYTFSNRNTDLYDSYINYCSVDTIRTHRTFHDFYCSESCDDHTSWVNDSLIQNCSLQDGWYDSGQTQWINETQCTEREQKEQKYRDYTCNPIPTTNCTYTNTSAQWVNTTNTRPKPESTPCNDGLWCSATDHCDGQGNCVQLTPRDCSGFNLSKIETCDNIPDNFASTFDWRNPFTSICNETSDSCTNGNSTIEHFCADANATDGGPAVPVGDGIRTCSAQCDGFGAECLPYLGEDDFCYINGQCNSNPSACTCSWNKDGYCPDPGTVIDGYCYWGERYCTENGCSLNKTIMGCNDECDPETGPKDTIGPITTQVNLTRKCNIINVTANVSNCNDIEEAEYFYDECPNKNTRGIPLSALDGSFNSPSEIVYVYNIDLANTTEILLDGRHNIYIRGKDEFGNWGECNAIGFDLDIYPPYTAEQYVESQVACEGNSSITAGGNVTITALVCEPLFLNQSFICKAEYFLDDFTKANGEGFSMQPIDGNWGDDYCEWVTATLNTSQLIEGTHWIKIHAMDCFCNWGKIDFLIPIWFIKDTTPPITDKTLIPFEGKVEQCFDNEQAVLPQGVQLTNGCSYVKSGTQIVLSAQDQDTPDHEFSNRVRIHWKVWYKVNAGDSWTVDQEGVGGEEQNVTITLSKDSYHLIEYWTADSCGNEETHHFELDIVDNKPPTITKIEGDPKVACDIEDPTGCVYFVQDHVTPIDLYCLDQQPHPVGHVKLWYRILLDGQVLQNWTDPTAEGQVHKQIIFNEDSIHTLQYYCEDALGNSEGTINQPHQQVYRVDSTAPNTTKTYGQPLVTTNGGYPKWINSSTPITLTAVDGGDVCHVGVDKTWYKDRVLYGEDQIACYNPQEYCKPQLLQDCQYCQNGNYPKECINQQQEYCTEEEGYNPYTEDWYNCVEEESQYHCCGGWDWKLYRNEPIFKPEESCHVLYYFSVDKLGNVENISVNCFFVDNTPSVSQKTVGEPKKQVDCIEFGEGEFTDGCYYITQNTQINLTCSDGQPHPVDNVKIYYKIDWKNESADTWQEGQWTDDSDFVSFNYDTDSFHRLTWYCVDALGNKEQDHAELDIVDTQEPVVTKTVGSPKVSCQGGEGSFFDNVESGQDGWTTSGLWHITNYRSYSPTHSWAYNQESDHTYDVGYTTGNLISPLVVLGSNSQLKFWSFEKTECGNDEPECPWDKKQVYISDNGGSTWTKVWEGETEGQWYQVTIDLSAYASETIKIKFNFDTGDDEANSYEGWYVDNIEITGTANDCWYITQQTPITLTCYDQQPHPVDNEVIHWRYQLNNNGTWFDFEHTGTEVTFYYPEDSNHTLEYWCTDYLGNTAEHQEEIDIVDTQAPNTTKNIIGPQFYNQTQEKLYLDGVTEIELTCVDPEPHPVNDVDIYYRYRVDDGTWGSWTLYTGKFKFPEESKHELEYYCIDALGNEEIHQSEIDYVDHTPPVTTKTYGQPYYTEEGSEWINSSTSITLTATDGTEIHASGVDKTYYRISLVDPKYCSGEWDCDDAQGSGSFNIYSSPFYIQDQSCHLIEFYSADNVNKTETVKKQCPYVENTPPVSQKEVSEPKHECTEGEWYQYGEPADGCWYINQSTIITLTCSDGEPHPVDNVNIYYRDYLLGQTAPSFTLVQGGYVEISKNEDSTHVLEWYCTDALGNEEQHHYEIDIVDSQYPNVTKTVGEPKVSCGQNCWYITNNTEITLDCSDGEPHPVDHVSTYYRYYLDGQLIQDWTLYTDSFKLLEYSNHTVQYYCKDILGNTGPIFTEEDKVDNIPPVIIPDPCYDIKSEDKVTIWAIITDDKVGIDETTTKAYIECPEKDVQELLLVYNSTTGHYEAQWTASDVEGVCYVDFAASDLLGNSAYLDDGKFIVIDNTPPQISSVFTGRTWIGLGDKFYVDAEVDDNSVHFERMCKPLKCLVRIVDNAGKDAYLEGQLEFVQGVLKCAGFVTVNDTFYEAQAQLWVDAIDGAGNMASERKLEPIGIDNARMISIEGINSSKWFKGGQWINGVVATVDSSIFGEVTSCLAYISGMTPENTLQPVDNTCVGNIRIPTDMSDGEKILTIKATNINGKIVSDSVNVRIDNTAPEKEILSPVNGTFISTLIPIVMNVTDLQSGVYNASFRIVKDPLVIFGLITLPGTGYDSGWISTIFNGTTWNYTFNASDLTPGETYYFLSLVCDNVGNCKDPLSYTIVIVDKTAPTWPLLSKLTVTFSPYDKDGDVILGWPEASDKNGVDHYVININGIMKAATAGTAYTVKNLANGFYAFEVIPVDKVGNRGSALTGSTTVNRNCTVDETCTPAPSSSPSSSPSGSSGSSSGTSYGGSSTSPKTTGGTTNEDIVQAPEETTQNGQECIPYWLCGSWSECKDGKQTRKCVDKNNCVETSKTETQDCKPEIAPTTGLFTLINSPLGYGVIGALAIFVILAILGKRKFFK